MMRICRFVVGALLLGTSGAGGQSVRYGLGAGLLLPIVDYNDIDKVGWVVGADITYWLPSTHVGIRAEGSFSQTRQRAGACCLADHTTQLAGGMADLVYAFGARALRVRPYLFAGLGVYNLRLSAPGFVPSSDARVGFGGGAGIAYRAGSGSTRVFLESKATSLTLNGAQFASIVVRVGLRFGRKQP